MQAAKSVGCNPISSDQPEYHLADLVELARCMRFRNRNPEELMNKEHEEQLRTAKNRMDA